MGIISDGGIEIKCPYPEEIRAAAQRHVSIMRQFVFDLEWERSAMYKEYHAELAKIGIVRK